MQLCGKWESTIQTPVCRKTRLIFHYSPLLRTRLFIFATSMNWDDWRRPRREGAVVQWFDERIVADSGVRSSGSFGSAPLESPLERCSRPDGETYPKPMPHWRCALGCDPRPEKRPAHGANGSQ